MQDKQESVLSKDFAKKLKQLRINRGWSQGQLAQKIGIEANRISRYERGVLWPTLELLVKIAQVYEVSIDFLIRDEEVSSNQIGNKELLKRMEEVDNLPFDYQQILVTILDAFVKKYRFEQLAQN